MDTRPLLALLDTLDDILQSGPPPTGPPPDDWSGEFRQAVADVVHGGQPDRVSVVFDLLGTLGWTQLWQALDGLARPIGLDSPRSELDYIHQAAVDQPNLDARIRSAVVAALMRKYSPSQPVQLDWLETLARWLPTLGGRDQLSVLQYLGITGMDAEGLIAVIASLAVEAGTLASPVPAAMMAQGATVPFGDWDKPGRMPDHLYIANQIHVAIGIEYALAHPGHEVYVSTVPVNTILTRLVEALKISIDRAALEKALSRKRPDIFDYSTTHAGLPGWVFEIKSATLARDAVTEGQWYAEIFLAALIDTQPGPPWAPGATGCVPAPNGRAYYWPAGPGALVYFYERARLDEIAARDAERGRQTSYERNRAAFEDALTSGDIVAGGAPAGAAAGAALVAILIATAIPVVPPPP
jgi:hypothetical protein